METGSMVKERILAEVACKMKCYLGLGREGTAQAVFLLLPRRSFITVHVKSYGTLPFHAEGLGLIARGWVGAGQASHNGGIRYCGLRPTLINTSTFSQRPLLVANFSISA
jgi:hypothetical protein